MWLQPSLSLWHESEQKTQCPASQQSPPHISKSWLPLRPCSKQYRSNHLSSRDANASRNCLTTHLSFLTRGIPGRRVTSSPADTGSHRQNSSSGIANRASVAFPLAYMLSRAERAVASHRWADSTCLKNSTDCGRFCACLCPHWWGNDQVHEWLDLRLLILGTREKVGVAVPIGDFVCVFGMLCYTFAVLSVLTISSGLGSFNWS